MITIIFLMILLHILDDFVLQTAVLNKLKCKSWWEENVNPVYKATLRKGYKTNIYENDYKIALFIHGLSWSIMIHLPIMIFMSYNQLLMAIMIISQAVIHAIIDDLKANKHEINLITDQVVHFVQMCLSFLLFYLLT